MKIVDLNFNITQLNGEVVESAGKIIAGILVQDTKDPDPVKLYDWALNLHNGKSISLDSSDFTKFRTIIINHPHVFALVKAMVVKYLDSLKEQ